MDGQLMDAGLLLGELHTEYPSDPIVPEPLHVDDDITGVTYAPTHYFFDIFVQLFTSKCQFRDSKTVLNCCPKAGIHKFRESDSKSRG